MGRRCGFVVVAVASVVAISVAVPASAARALVASSVNASASASLTPLASASPSALPGGYTLDGFGGLHPFATGSGAIAPRTSGGGYWNGWDIARGIAILADGSGGYMLDGFGGLHPVAIGAGTAPPRLAGVPYWLGWDIARGVALLPDMTGGYVVDAYGGVHPFGVGSHSAPPQVLGLAYWPGQDHARGIAITGDGKGGFVVDRTGVLHPFRIGSRGVDPPSPTGVFLSVTVSVQGAALFATGAGGYTVDGFGALHSFGTGTASGPPAAIGAAAWPGWDIARDVAVLSPSAPPPPPPPVDLPPTAALSVSPASGVAPLTVTANASASRDTDATPIASYRFDFGDGTIVGPQAQATAAHTYNAPGAYTATVTVADTAGLTASASRTVSVGTVSSGDVAVYAGYYDTHHRYHPRTKPSPWRGSADTVFVGIADDSSDAWDSSAVRVDNTSSGSLAITVTVTIGKHTFDLWGERVVPAGQHLVLAQMGFETFDGSDSSTAGCYGCDPKLCDTKVDPTVPIINVTIGGMVRRYYDRGQVLNTAGVDLAGCPDTGGTRNDESTPWTAIPGPG